jgi:protein-tyrosine-phosphatase
MDSANFWTQPHSHPIHLIFLCAGNICRSPYAELKFKHLLHKSGKIDPTNFTIESGGFLTQKSVQIHPFTRQKLIEELISLDQIDAHFPRTMRKHKQDLLNANVLIVMTKDQKNILMPKKYMDKTLLLSEIAEPGKEIDIPDPALITDFQEYSAIMDVIDGYLQQMIHTLESLNLY